MRFHRFAALFLSIAFVQLGCGGGNNRRGDMGTDGPPPDAPASCTLPTECDDSIACTTDDCNTGTSTCTNVPDDAACDDSNDCTVDTCGTTGCENANVTNGMTCMNGAGSAGTCQTGVCEVACEFDVECNDGVDCTNDTCNLTSNICENTPTDSLCDDGVACTTNSCHMTADCQYTPDNGACEDDNPCTSNLCGSAGCTFPAVTSGTICQDGMGDNGLCMGTACTVECDEDADCSDDDMCTGIETCNLANGQCVAGTPLECDDEIDCTTDSCSPSTGCGHVANDGMCNDGGSCTTDSCSLTSGCVNTPNNGACNDNNTCTSDVCGSNGTCSNPPANEGNVCMVGATPGICDNGDCNTDCMSAAQCNDGIPCTTDSCNMGTGQCEHTPNNGMCNDSRSCTTDVCVVGTGCSNTVPMGACNDSNPCTTDSCGPTACVNAAVTPGTLCQSMGDNGLCMGTMCVVECDANPDCNDNNVCNGVETCNLSNGQCVDGMAPNCNDGIPCTTDGCNMTTGCTHVANDGMCNDSIPCTTDTCSLTLGCQNMPNNGMCDDMNACTTDVCNQMTGCQNPDVMDGTMCPTGTCMGGMCQAQATVFRVSTLSLRDPHLYLNANPFNACLFCDDITNQNGTCSSILGTQTAPAINPALNTGIAMDGTDADTFLDLSFMLAFNPLVQNGNDGSDIRIVDGNCSNATTCVPRPMAIMNTMTTYSTEAGGSGASCLAAIMGTTFANTWADGMMSGINAPAAGTNGCFATAAATLNVNFQISGTPVTLPLTNAQIAGTFTGSPATAISNGLLRGFLTDAAAAAVNITVPSPLGNVTINLRDQLLPDAGSANGCPARTHCNGVDPDMGSPNNNSPDARDVDDMTCGWWFYINFTASRIMNATGF